MICRLVIISIVIANASNDLVASYMLIIVCGIIDLIHLLVKPYNNEMLNKFDGIVLHLIIFITALPWVDDFDSPLVLAIAFVLVILPLLSFIIFMLFLHKNDLKKTVTRFTTKVKAKPPSSSIVNKKHLEIPMKEFNYSLIVDDSMRDNATICDR